MTKVVFDPVPDASHYDLRKKASPDTSWLTSDECDSLNDLDWFDGEEEEDEWIPFLKFVVACAVGVIVLTIAITVFVLW